MPRLLSTSAESTTITTVPRTIRKPTPTACAGVRALSARRGEGLWCYLSSVSGHRPQESGVRNIAGWVARSFRGTSPDDACAAGGPFCARRASGDFPTGIRLDLTADYRGTRRPARIKTGARTGGPVHHGVRNVAKMSQMSAKCRCDVQLVHLNWKWRPTGRASIQKG